MVQRHLFNRMDSLLAISYAVPEMAKVLCEVYTDNRTVKDYVCILYIPYTHKCLFTAYILIHDSCGDGINAPCPKISKINV